MSLKRGIFYTFLTQVPTLLLYFVSSTFLTRVLGDEGRGAFALLTNQSALISMLLGLNLTFGINYFVSQEKGNPARMVRVASSCLVFNLILVPLLLGLIFWSSGLNKIFLPPGTTHWGYFLFLFFTIIIAQLIGWIAAIMLALKKFTILNRISILNAAMAAIGYSTLYLVRDRIAPEYILPMVLAVSLISALISLTIWLAVYVRVVGLPPVPIWNWSVLRPVLAFSMVGYLSNLVNLVNYRFDIWVVGSYAGTAQLGLYVAAAGIGQLLFYIPDPFSRVVQPYLYRGLNAELLERFKFISRLNFTSVALLAIVLGIAAPWFIPLLYGQVFQGAVAPLLWLLPGIVFVCMFKLFAPLVIEGGFIRFNLYATAIAAVFTIVLDLLLIPRMGIIGAALATTLSYLILFIVQCWVIRFRMHIPVTDMFFMHKADLSKIIGAAMRSLARPRFRT